MSGDHHPCRQRPHDRENEIARLTAELQRIADALYTSELVTGPTNDNPHSPGSCERLRLAEAMLDARRRVTKHLKSSFFADPARDLLLDLYISSLHGRRVSVSSACIAAAVPATTALRWISRLRQEGLIVPELDQRDSRRIFVRLTDHAFTSMDRYLAEVLTLLQPASGA